MKIASLQPYMVGKRQVSQKKGEWRRGYGGCWGGKGYLTLERSISGCITRASFESKASVELFTGKTLI